MFVTIKERSDYIQKFVGMKLLSAGLIHENTSQLFLDKEWECATEDGYVLIKYSSGILSMAYSECEHDLRSKLQSIATANEFMISKLSFSQIKDFMSFKIDEDDYFE